MPKTESGGLTYREVAAIMGITPEAVRQIEKKALKKLKWRLREILDKEIELKQ